VLSTQVGYAGGRTENPTYNSIGDHSETIQIVFDPSVISYEELLAIFWEAHDPTASAYSRQYRSLILAADQAQARAAELSKRREEERRGAPIQTEILTDWRFTPAEDYHQKYSLRADSLLLGELKAMYPREEDFVRSTAAARINGYLGGNGTLEQLKSEIDSFGLSEEAREHLLRTAERRLR
jgi:peptide-methionine (S)-S-oxide reductase